jgi:hypothetical protein
LRSSAEHLSARAMRRQHRSTSRAHSLPNAAVNALLVGEVRPPEPKRAKARGRRLFLDAAEAMLVPGERRTGIRPAAPALHNDSGLKQRP